MKLVLGYGNELRSDDGVGPLVARRVAAWQHPDITAQALHQLTPELADLLAGAACVIFVDACVGEVASVQVERLTLTGAASGPGHLLDPRALLQLTAALHDRSPEAWLVSIPAFNLDFGESLSAQTAQLMPSVLGWIASLLAVSHGIEPADRHEQRPHAG